MCIELTKFFYLFSGYSSCNYKHQILCPDLHRDDNLCLMELMHQPQKAVIDVQGLAIRIQGMAGVVAPFNNEGLSVLLKSSCV